MLPLFLQDQIKSGTRLTPIFCDSHVVHHRPHIVSRQFPIFDEYSVCSLNWKDYKIKHKSASGPNAQDFPKHYKKELDSWKKKILAQNLMRKKVIVGSPHRSKGTNDADGDPNVDFQDCSTDDEHINIAVKELPEVDINDETLLESDDNSISLESQYVRGKRKSPTEENTCTGNRGTKKNLVSCSHQVYIKSQNKSTGTKGTNCPNVDESTKIAKKELLVVDISNESDDDSTPLEGQSVGGENSESALKFTAFEDFKIDVNGETLNSEIPSDVLMKYYKLCCGQKKLIHDGVVKGIDSKFAVSVILEIVRIADSTKAADISTAPHILECMEKTLKFYHHDLGFAVGSLRAKIDKLTEFSSEQTPSSGREKAKARRQV